MHLACAVANGKGDPGRQGNGHARKRAVDVGRRVCRVQLQEQPAHMQAARIDRPNLQLLHENGVDLLLAEVDAAALEPQQRQRIQAR
jgi:hypothetical protein